MVVILPEVSVVVVSCRRRCSVRVVAASSRTWWIVDTLDNIGVRDAHLALEAIRVPEEEAQDVAEVGDEPVGRLAFEKACPDLVEGFDRFGLEREVVESAPPEHWHLPGVFFVAGDLEDVEFCRGSKHHRDAEPRLFLQRLRRCLEDIVVERQQSVGV